MNNHHLFLIRADQVTQLLAHLTAGIITLVLISSLSTPPGDTGIDRQTVPGTEVVITLPAGAEMIAAAQ